MKEAVSVMLALGDASGVFAELHAGFYLSFLRKFSEEACDMYTGFL